MVLDQFLSKQQVRNNNDYVAFEVKVGMALGYYIHNPASRVCWGRGRIKGEELGRVG